MIAEVAELTGVAGRAFRRKVRWQNNVIYAAEGVGGVIFSISTGCLAVGPRSDGSLHARRKAVGEEEFTVHFIARVCSVASAIMILHRCIHITHNEGCVIVEVVSEGCNIYLHLLSGLKGFFGAAGGPIGSNDKEAF